MPQKNRKKKIQDYFNQIEGANENKELQEIIKQRYTAISEEVNPRKAHLRKGIIYSAPNPTISSYQALNKEQLLEVNKIYSKLAILEKENILKNAIPHLANSKLRETIGNAFSSVELIHYGEIKQDNILEIPKEVADIFALVQQVEGIEKSKVEEIKQAIVTAVKSEKQFPKVEEVNSQLRDNISIAEMYELTDGKVESGKANTIVRDMYYLSKSRQNTIALSNVLNEVLGNNPDFEETIGYIRENGFRIEPEIISRQSNKGIKISEAVNLKIEENSLLEEIKQLSSDELEKVIQNGGFHNTQDISFKQSVIKYSYKNGVTAVAVQFNLHRKTIYRWREKYDGTLKRFPFKIEEIQTDNGFEFTNRLSYNTSIRDRKTLFEETLEQLGVKHKLIKPYTPRHNGKVERSHRKD